jgi:hypothetical protein
LTETRKSSSLCSEGEALFERHPPHFSTAVYIITRAIELGVDFKTIAAWQGHRDGGVLIAKTYSHLRNEHSDAMALKLKMIEP